MAFARSSGFCGFRQRFARFKLGGRLVGEPFVVATAFFGALVPAAAARTVIFLLLAMGMGVLFEKLLPIGNGDLVVIRVDFGKGEETVPVAAVIDESRLKRRFYAGDLGQIDIAAKLLFIGRFEVKFLDAVTACDDNPGLLGVRGIDEHFVGHVELVRAWHTARRCRLRFAQARSKGGGAGRMAPNAKGESEKMGPDLWAVTCQHDGRNREAASSATPEREHQLAPELQGACCKMSSWWSE